MKNKISKMVLLSLLVLWVFISCHLWADEIKEPRVVKINDYLLVYEDVAEKIIKKTVCDNVVKKSDSSIRICDDDPLLKKVIILYNRIKHCIVTAKDSGCSMKKMILELILIELKT